MFRRRLSAPTCLILSLLVALAAIPSANARNRHHHGQTGSAQSSKSDGIQAKDVNDQHVKAASDDVDKILDNKIKNICRGC